MSGTPAPCPAELLAASLRADAARALLTFHDDASGERVELSVATFANWVAKTANVCRDGLGLGLGARVALVLPVHWQAAVWWQACWVSGFAGIPVTDESALPEDCDVVVVGLDGDPGTAARLAAAAGERAGEVVGLGLGPLGLPVPGRPAPAAVTLDYDREVHGHGDRFLAPPGLGPDLPALWPGAGRSGSRPWTAGALGSAAVAAAARWDVGPSDRLLCAAPFADLATLLAGLLVPLASGAGALLCRHLDRLDDAGLARRVVTEGVTAVTGSAGLRVPRARHLH